MGSTLDGSKENRNESWPMIADILTGLGVGAAELQFHERLYYGHSSVEKWSLVPILAKDSWPLTPLTRLLLVPAVDDVILRDLRFHSRWWRNKKGSYRSRVYCLIRDIVHISSHPYYTFSDRSYFGGREQDILEALGYADDDYAVYVKERVSEIYAIESNWEECLCNIRSFRDYLWNSRPSKHDVSWMTVFHWRAEVHAITDEMPIGESLSIDKELIAAAWGRSNPNNLDPRVVRLCNLICETFESRDASRSIREYFQRTIDPASTQSKNFHNSFQPGKKVTVAVKVESENQLKAMLSRINSETCFPLNEPRPPKIPYVRPNPSDREPRHQSEWENELHIDSYEVIDQKTLLFYPKTQLAISYSSFEALTIDATGIKETSNKKRFKHCAVVGDSKDEWIIYMRDLFAPVSNTPTLREIASSFSTPEELALSLANEAGSILIERCKQEQRSKMSEQHLDRITNSATEDIEQNEFADVLTNYRIKYQTFYEEDVFNLIDIFENISDEYELFQFIYVEASGSENELHDFYGDLIWLIENASEKENLVLNYESNQTKIDDETVVQIRFTSERIKYDWQFDSYAVRTDFISCSMAWASVVFGEGFYFFDNGECIRAWKIPAEALVQLRKLLPDG